MKRKRRSRNFWTKERCSKEALKYKLRSVFKSNSGGAYNSSIKNGWLEEVCSHMSVVGNKFKRLVYVYEFDDKSIYIGLTFNIETRDKKHKRDVRSPVFKYIKKTGIQPVLEFSEYLDIREAVRLESEKIEHYKKQGFNVLNASSGGEVGGHLKWTKERCLEEAKKYSSRTQFARNSNSAYNSARNNGWLNEVCSNMPKKDIKPMRYWTKERCEKEALKYKSKKELCKKSPGSYSSMQRNNWLNELCLHMNTKKPNGYWTKERCLEEALNYSSKKELRENNESVYVKVVKNKWLNECAFKE